MSEEQVIIIGGGLSGLCCAKVLHSNNVPFQLLEASDRIGGRVKTDSVDGFLLDHGFQVLLTAYPEAQSVLDYSALELKSFSNGALCRVNGKFERLADPWREPSKVFETAFSKVGSLADKFLVRSLRSDSRKGTVDEIFQREETTTLEALKNFGFSEAMINRFFRPFLGGVFLDTDLETSNRMLHFVFRMFSQGDVAIPANGMQAIPNQLASALPEVSIRLNTKVESINGSTVKLGNGEVINGSAIVLATEETTTSKLLPESGIKVKPPRSVTCLYFAAPKAPHPEPILLLNGEGKGLVNNVCVPSNVAPNYAPDGQSLVSITVVNPQGKSDDELNATVLDEMKAWFGESVDDWRHLKSFQIPYALPNQSPPAYQKYESSPKLRDGLFLCGDYRKNGSIQGAMVSGRLAAESIIAKQ